MSTPNLESNKEIAVYLEAAFQFQPAYEAVGTAIHKQNPEDFMVDEIFEWDFKGSGEHLFCKIRKSNLNTAEAIKLIAKSFSCRARYIGYAGLKDKHATTTQWLSIPVKIASVESEQYNEKYLEDHNIQILEMHRHDKKLRQGQSKGNHFSIRLREIDVSRAKIEERIQALQQYGFPNYFGEQRFGIQAKNIKAGLIALFSNNKSTLVEGSGFYLSSLRSYLFNLILSARVKNKTWNQYLCGDVMQLNGTHSVFAAEPDDEQIEQRFKAGDVESVGPLWGDHQVSPNSSALSLEQDALLAYQKITEHLSTLNVKANYRPFCAKPTDLKLTSYEESTCLIEFSLKPGQYATELIKQLFSIKQRNDN